MGTKSLENKKRKTSKIILIVIGSICAFCFLLFYFARISLFGPPEKKLPITRNIPPVSSLKANLVYQSNKDVQYAEEITIEGLRAYVLDGHRSRIYILDIIDPENPRITSTYSPTNFYVSSMKAQGDYLYIDIGNLEFLDVTDENKPLAIWQLETDGAIKSITPSLDYLFVTDTKSNLYIIDISKPREPKLSKRIEKFNNLDYIEDATVNGDLLFVVNKGLYIFDISTPTKPIEIGFYRLPIGIDYFDSIVIMDGIAWVRGSYTDIFGDSQSYVLLLDISDPSNPTLISTYDHYPFATFNNFICFYNTSTHSESIHLMDFSNPKNPIELGYISSDYSSLGYPSAIIARNNSIYVYATNYGDGINIIKYSISYQ